MDSTMMAQQMGHAPYYVYAPDARPDSKHQAARYHQQQQQQGYPMVPTLPSTPVYSRPNSSCSQQAVQVPPPTLYSNGPGAVTPVASPQPSSQKPNILLETESFDDGLYFPATPPLSSAGSSMSSPNSCDILQTPMNPMFSGLDGVEEPVKETYESIENPILDWASCGSPPLTPVFLQGQQSQTHKAISHFDIPSFSGSNNINNNTVAPSATSAPVAPTSVCESQSSNISCPSLSPSPAPAAKPVTTQQLPEVNFCDPRNLTVGTASAPAPAALAPDFSSFTSLEEAAPKTAPASEAAVPATNDFDFSATSASGLPTFEEISGLESDEDFVNGLVNLGNVEDSSDSRRPRACTGSSVVSLGHASFIGDDDFSIAENDSFLTDATSPQSAVSEHEDSHQDKRRKVSKDSKAVPVMANPNTETAQAVESPAQEHNGSDPSSPADSKDESRSDDNASTSSHPAPANRRGRKQSLTEDPTKTFVCELCNRRFRRQEHLKRHYRSLHTHDKPFECNECGKTFSRSDNLAQHARTHGSGAIVMDFIEDPNAHYDGMMGAPAPGEDYQHLGKVLFQVASEIPGSASETSSDDSGSDQDKKRKRAN